MIIGPHTATVRINGKAYKGRPIYLITLPEGLLKEIEAKGESLEHLDEVRITLEKIGTKAAAKPWGFKKKEVKIGVAPQKEILEELEDI